MRKKSEEKFRKKLYGFIKPYNKYYSDSFLDGCTTSRLLQFTHPIDRNKFTEEFNKL